MPTPRANHIMQTALRISFLLAVGWVLLKVRGILWPVLLSVVLAFFLNPLVDFFERRRLPPFRHGMPRSLAILLTFVIAAAAVAGLGTSILLPFIYEFSSLAENLPGILAEFTKVVIRVQESYSQVQLPDNIRAITDQAINNAASYSIRLVDRLIRETLGLASRIIELVIVPILTFYFLKDWQIIRESFISAVPLRHRDRARQVSAEIGVVISGYIRGQVAVSIIIGMIVFVGMYFFGIEYALVLGLLATITEAVPIIGPIIGAVPAILLALLTSPALAVKVTAFYIIVHQLENHIIVPNVMGQHIDLHPVTVILAILIGSQLLGFMGMILAVPFAAVLKVLFKHLWTPA